jgi:integrase
MTLRFSRLGRDNVRKLEPGRAISEHGITAQKLANGDVRWSINIMADGRRIHRVVGTESAGVTRYQAEQIIEKIRTECRAERFGLAKPDARKVPTLTKAAGDYLTRMVETGGRNLRHKRIHLRCHLVAFFGPTRLDAITSFAIERYKRDRTSAGASKTTVNRELATLSHLLSMALEWGWIDRISVRPKKFTEDNGRIVTLTDAELDRLLQAAIAGPDCDLWLFIAIARATGMRHSEILRMKWQNCDLASRRIYLPQAKAGARVQPITITLADILKHERAGREDQEGWIFPARARSNRGHLKSFERSFRRAVIKVGLDPKIVTPHVLRHTAITKLVQSGADLITIMAISGHRSLRMVQRYAHVSAPHIDEVIAALDKSA